MSDVEDAKNKISNWFYNDWNALVSVSYVANIFIRIPFYQCEFASMFNFFYIVFVVIRALTSDFLFYSVR